MGAAKRLFEDTRQYEKLLEEVRGNDLSENMAFSKVRKLANMIAPGHIGDFKGFHLLLQCGKPPRQAAYLTLGPKYFIPVSSKTEPEHKLGNYWDEWQNNPDRYNEERDNRL